MVGNLGVFGSSVLLLLRHLNMVVEKQVAGMMGGVRIRGVKRPQRWPRGERSR